MFSRYKKPFREDKGFTLLEVMVAITILLLVILPLASLYVRSLTVIQNAALYSQAIQLGQERMEICQVLDYHSLKYYNQVFTPGFPYSGALPPSHQYDRDGNAMNPVAGNAYDNRDNPDTTNVELYFDPTDSYDEHYPVPVYRDYYNNYTGMCLDPNFNGLCDDDLDGDGNFGILANPVDMEDIEMATNGLLRQYSDPEFSGTPAASLGDTYVPGDGLYDTVIEGNYVASMDPMYRLVRITESPTPILDMGLLLDTAHRGVVSDFRYREATYQNIVRMTTFIDPTPDLGNPNNVGTWIDQLYKRDREVGGYTNEEMEMLDLCLNRDLPLGGGFSNFNVGTEESGFVSRTELNVNYSPPIYGIKVIVTVFYLTGEGEMQLTDIDGDGTVEEIPMETYGGARRVRLERTFYNDWSIRGNYKQYAPPRRFVQSSAGTADNPVRSITIPLVHESGDDSDPCDLDHNGLPYLD